MYDNLRELALTEEFDYNFAVSALSQYKQPRVKINNLLKKGSIVRIKKGLYVFGPKLSRQPYVRETLANLIYGPSYISLEYALSFYGLARYFKHGSGELRTSNKRQMTAKKIAIYLSDRYENQPYQ